jgi:hypothetical protein
VAADVHQILDCDRQTVQRPAHASRRALAIGHVGGVQRVVAVDVDERMKARVERSYAIEATLDDFARRQGAGSKPAREFGQRREGGIGHVTPRATPSFSRRAASAYPPAAPSTK